MARYIDAEICRRRISDERTDDKRWNEALNRACRIVCEQPTVDAVPVKHGHWIVIENDQNTDDRYKMQCSVCGETLWSIAPEELYCCKCGAKMDVLDTNVGNKEKVTES